MTEGNQIFVWGVAIAAISAVTGLAFLAHSVVGTLLSRVDQVQAVITREMGERFASAESRRTEASAAWQERLAIRDEAIRALQADVGAVRADLAANYVRRDTYLEAEGRTMIKLEQIRAAISAIEAPRG